MEGTDVGAIALLHVHPDRPRQSSRPAARLNGRQGPTSRERATAPQTQRRKPERCPCPPSPARSPRSPHHRTHPGNRETLTPRPPFLKTTRGPARRQLFTSRARTFLSAGRSLPILHHVHLLHGVPSPPARGLCAPYAVRRNSGHIVPASVSTSAPSSSRTSCKASPMAPSRPEAREIASTSAPIASTRGPPPLSTGSIRLSGRSDRDHDGVDGTSLTVPPPSAARQRALVTAANPAARTAASTPSK